MRDCRCNSNVFTPEQAANAEKLLEKVLPILRNSPEETEKIEKELQMLVDVIISEAWRGF